MAEQASPGRARVLATGVLVVAFLAGLAAGFTVDWLDLDERVRAPGREQRSRGGVLADLGLSVEQRARIDAILAERERQTELFWDSAGPRLRQIVDSARADIRSVLTPAQREEFDRRIAQRKSRERDGAGDGDKRGTDRPK